VVTQRGVRMPVVPRKTARVAVGRGPAPTVSALQLLQAVAPTQGVWQAPTPKTKAAAIEPLTPAAPVVQPSPYVVGVVWPLTLPSTAVRTPTLTAVMVQLPLLQTLQPWPLVRPPTAWTPQLQPG